MATVEKVRDLEADLAICEAATPGPWAVVSEKFVVQDRFDKDDYRQAIFKAQHLPNLADDMKFAAEARTGWPYAIRRAMEAKAAVRALHAEIVSESLRADTAEAKVDRLVNELRMLQDSLNRGCMD